MQVVWQMCCVRQQCWKQNLPWSGSICTGAGPAPAAGRTRPSACHCAPVQASGLPMPLAPDQASGLPMPAAPGQAPACPCPCAGAGPRPGLRSAAAPTGRAGTAICHVQCKKCGLTGGGRKCVGQRCTEAGRQVGLGAGTVFFQWGSCLAKALPKPWALFPVFHRCCSGWGQWLQKTLLHGPACPCPMGCQHCFLCVLLRPC